MHDSRFASLRRALSTRHAGWQLAGGLALLGILLGVQRLGWDRLIGTFAAWTGHALAQGVQLVLDAGWLLLLLSAASLALGLAFNSPRRRAAVGWLRLQLTMKPVRWGLAAAGLLMLLVLVVVVLPPRFTEHRHFNTAAEEFRAQNDVRTTLLQGLGALLVLTGAAIGASVTLRQIRVSQGQLQATREQISQTVGRWNTLLELPDSSSS